MSAGILTPRITVDQFLLRPERTDGMQEELLDGEIIVSPHAKPLHSQVSANVYDLLLPLKAHGFTVLGETAFRLTDYSLPNTDVTVLQREAWQAALARNEFPRQAPALAVEVHSPANRAKNMLRKLRNTWSTVLNNAGWFTRKRKK